MDKRQATADSAGDKPHAARTPAGTSTPEPDDDAYELPPAPAPGALWSADSAQPPVPASATPVSAAPPASTVSATPPASSVSAAPPASSGGSVRPVSAMPSANAARASVPGAMRFDPAEGSKTRPLAQAKVYGARPVESADPSQTDQPADSPDIEPSDAAEPAEPSLPEPSTPHEPSHPAPAKPEPPRPVEPEKPIEPPPGPLPKPAPPGPFPGPTPSPAPRPAPTPPTPGPVPPGPDPSPVPPGPDPSPVPPGPDPSPVPPGPGPSPVPGPPAPIFPPPMMPAAGGLPSYTLPPAAPEHAPPPYGARPEAQQPQHPHSAPSAPFGSASQAPAHSQPVGARLAAPEPAGQRAPTIHNAPREQQPNPYARPGQAYTPEAAPPTAPFGVGSSGASRQPFGGPSAPVSAPHGPAGSVPQQRGQGTVYGRIGSDSPIDMTMPVSMNALENSGSLTGHILSQGWAEPPDTRRRSNTKVAVAMLLVFLGLIGVSLLFLFTAGSAFTNMINGIFHR